MTELKNLKPTKLEMISLFTHSLLGTSQTNAKLPGLECVGAVPGNIYEELCKILSNIHSLPASNDRL